jgi:hypothetical protein
VSTEFLREDLDRTRLLKRGGHRTLCEFEFAIDRADTTGVYAKPAEYWQKFKEAHAHEEPRPSRTHRKKRLP